jgi:DNA-binding LacI/PurR family transcriptional regulator
MRDVARRAGVSHQTVSRVINGHDNVSQETRRRVEAAIRELHYVPNPNARGLTSNRTHSLGLVTADISDHFFAEAAAGAEIEARRRGYYLIIASVEEDARDDERGYLRLMVERRVEGLILARPELPVSSDQLSLPSGARVPLVALGSSELPGFTVVDVDNRQGGFDAVSFLIGEGHREIATIVGPLEWPSTRARLDGYREALERAGLVDPVELVAYAPDWGLASGQRATAELLTRGASFTALFAQSDLMAIGAIRELRARGLRVPQDVSVVGYDDIPIASFFDPSLTTVSQPMREVGARAASLVLDALAEGGALAPGTHLLPAELVVRESTAARPPGKEERWPA